MRIRPSHFLLVEAERYRHLAHRTSDNRMAALWLRVVSEYEDLARRHDEHCERVQAAEVLDLDGAPRAGFRDELAVGA